MESTSCYTDWSGYWRRIKIEGRFVARLRPLALLFNIMFFEQQQKDAEIQAQAQKVKEETRRYDEVKQKLDALIDAERKMLERNKPVRKP